jgi:hypothetical protein
MSASPLKLVAQDKLDLLRYLDEFHYWHSLDDERRCKRCSRVINGHQILVFELEGTRGKLRLQCPTVACMSTPSDWVYADPFLAAKLRRDFRPGERPVHVANVLVARTARTHRRTDTEHKPNAAGTKTSAVSVSQKQRSTFISSVPLRALLARITLLRPIATALHAIRPVA